MTVPDTDSPEEEELSPIRKATPPRRVPLQTISANFSQFAKYAAPDDVSEASDSEFGSPPRGPLSSSASHQSFGSPPRKRARALIQSPSDRLRLQQPNFSQARNVLLPNALKGYDDTQGSALTDLGDVETPAFPFSQRTFNEVLEESALTDLRGVETPAFPYSQRTLREVVQESALTDLRDVDTPAFPYTQRSLHNDVEDSALTDLLGVETPAFPYTQENLVKDVEVAPLPSHSLEPVERSARATTQEDSLMPGVPLFLEESMREDSLMPGVLLIPEQSTEEGPSTSTLSKSRQDVHESPSAPLTEEVQGMSASQHTITRMEGERSSPRNTSSLHQMPRHSPNCGEQLLQTRSLPTTTIPGKLEPGGHLFSAANMIGRQPQTTIRLSRSATRT